MPIKFQPQSQPDRNYKPQTHAIRLHAGGSVVDGLTIDETHPGERDKKTNSLIGEGGVEFRTKANKTFFCRFCEFSFYIPAAGAPRASKRAAKVAPEPSLIAA